MLIIPQHYRSKLGIRDTERAIKTAKDGFEKRLAKALNLERVSAPIFVERTSGLNDDLNGVERPVSFDSPGLSDEIEIVHSLAKWKRSALARYGFKPGEGLYTDMNAIRRDEETDNLHSIYVDQWDWEKVIERSDRTFDTLRSAVTSIIDTLKQTEEELCSGFDLEPAVTEDVFFVSSEELLKTWPELTPKQREDAICREKKTVFISQIGKTLSDGSRHDGRAPDYDDWELNGDILVWYPLLDRSIELSSMGVRVDEESLLRQLKAANCLDRKELGYHKALLNGQLPYTVGGGIGQSRLCMVLLGKAHIGEVQASLWPEQMHSVCAEHGIDLL